MLARLPVETETRLPPQTARLVRGWGRRAPKPRVAGRRWDGKDEQLGEEGWDLGRWNGGGSSPGRSGPRQEVALGNQGCSQSREHLGTPKPKSSLHQRG